MGSRHDLGLANSAAAPIPRGVWACVFLLCVAAYTLTVNGRVTFPDDEVQIRTAEALWERGSFAIDPLEAPILEPELDASFGTAVGTDGRHYGIFGQGLAIVAAPTIPLGDALAARADPAWLSARRTNLGWYHRRSPVADWRRLVTTSLNVPILALAVVLFGRWLARLGVAWPIAVCGSLALGLGTFAWSYSSTFMSEPLSMLLLVAAAHAVARHHSARLDSPPAAARWLVTAAALTGAAAHVHLLNLTAIPAVVLYATRGRRPERHERAAWGWALAVGASFVLLLGVSHWLRFDSPFETGRYDIYGHWTWPFEALAAFVAAPGRSVFVFAPPVLVGVIGAVGAARRRARGPSPAAAEPRTPLDLAILAGALAIALRLGFVAFRSDWHGGWSLGPRYAVPILPFAVLPFVLLVARGSARTRRRAWIFLGACAIAQGWMALHAPYEHMFTLERSLGTEDYMAASHWSFDGAAPIGFAHLDGPAVSALLDGQGRVAVRVAPFDALSAGALRVGATAGRWGPALAFAFVGLAGACAACVLAFQLRRAGNASGPPSDDGSTPARPATPALASGAQS